MEALEIEKENNNNKRFSLTYLYLASKTHLPAHPVTLFNLDKLQYSNANITATIAIAMQEQIIGTSGNKSAGRGRGIVRHPLT